MHQYMLARYEIKEKAKAAVGRDRSGAILNWFLFGVILWAAGFLASIIGGNPIGYIMQEVMYGVSGYASEEQAMLGIVQAVYGIILSTLFSCALIVVINVVFAPVLKFGVYYNCVRIYRG